MNHKYEYIYKIVFVGESSVGKTEFINRYSDNTFCDKIIGK